MCRGRDACICLSVCPPCSYRHSRLWLTPRGCCLLKHLHPCPGEAARRRHRGSVVGRCFQRYSHTGVTVERGAISGGLGTEGEVEEAFGVQDGLSRTHHAVPEAPWARRDSVLGHPPSPHDSAAESGVLPLLQEQQRSEKPSNLITLMQVRAGGWYRLPLRAPAGGSLRSSAGLGSFSRDSGGRLWVGQPSLGGVSMQPAVPMSAGTEILR